jgi:hypothetical protein
MTFIFNENNYHKSIVGTTTIMSFNTAGNITLTTYEKNSKKHVKCKWLSEFHPKHENKRYMGIKFTKLGCKAASA